MPRVPTRIVLIVAFIACVLQCIKSECTINISNLAEDAPIILSTNTRRFLPLHNSPRGVAIIPEGFLLTLLCPKSLRNYNFFRYFPRYNELVVQCLPGNTFSLSGHNKTYHFDYLHCGNSHHPVILNTNTSCFGPVDSLDYRLSNKYTTKLLIGYHTDYEFLTVYGVCFDTALKGPRYAQEIIYPDIEKRENKESIGEWFTDENLYRAFNLEAEYYCPSQSSTFYRILNRNYFNDYGRCCFQKTRLVDGQDLVYPAQQISTFADVNTIPMCEQSNWIRVQDQIRQLAVSLNRRLTVWTGVFRIFTDVSAQTVVDRELYIHYNNDADKAVPVPHSTWKVIYDPYTERAVAIITLNDQKVSRRGPAALLMCRDVCPYLAWLNLPGRTDFKDGFTYCCELGDFLRGFNYIAVNPFPQFIAGLLTYKS